MPFNQHGISVTRPSDDIIYGCGYSSCDVSEYEDVERHTLPAIDYNAFDTKGIVAIAFPTTAAPFLPCGIFNLFLIVQLVSFISSNQLAGYQRIRARSLLQSI